VRPLLAAFVCLGCRARAALDTDAESGSEADTEMPEPDDRDGDGWTAGEDCADDDPRVNPDAKEDCDNGVDDDCNGTIDGACYPEDGFWLEFDAVHYGLEWYSVAGVLPDLDADGRDELVVSSLSAATDAGYVYVFPGAEIATVVDQGTLNLMEARLWGAGLDDVDWGQDVAIAGDVDGDGLHDLAITLNSAGAPTRADIYLGSSLSGSFEADTDVWMALADAGNPAIVGDVDGDDRADLGKGSHIWFSSTFGAGLELRSADAGAEIPEGTVLLGSDLDGDGYSDISSPAGPASWSWYGGADVALGGVVDPLSPLVRMDPRFGEALGSAIVGDVDADGLADVALASVGPSGGTVEVFCSTDVFSGVTWEGCSVLTAQDGDTLWVNFRDRWSPAVFDIDADDHSDLWLGGVADATGYMGSCLVPGADVGGGGTLAIAEHAQKCYFQGTAAPSGHFTRPGEVDLLLNHGDGFLLFQLQ
jgi:hypothetical protein